MQGIKGRVIVGILLALVAVGMIIPTNTVPHHNTNNFQRITSVGDNSSPGYSISSFRVHKGSDENSTHFVKHYRGLSKVLHSNDNSYGLVNTVTLIQVLGKEVSYETSLFSLSRLRGPPAIS